MTEERVTIHYTYGECFVETTGRLVKKSNKFVGFQTAEEQTALQLAIQPSVIVNKHFKKHSATDFNNRFASAPI